MIDGRSCSRAAPSSSSGSSARATTRSAKRLPRVPSETPAPRKAGARREATLNHRARRARRGGGQRWRSPARARAGAYERLALPSWRRSGLLGDEPRGARPGRARGDASTRPTPCTTGDPRRRAAHAGRARAARRLGRSRRARPASWPNADVILCSLEQAAAQNHAELFERYYLRRLTVDRHKLEAASAAFWSGGAFLYVPPGLQIDDPFQIVYEICDGRQRAVRAHARDRRPQQRDPPARVRPRQAGERADDALHAGQFELYLEDGARCRLAQLTGLGRRARFTTSRPRSSRSARDAYCHWLPALLGGHADPPPRRARGRRAGRRHGLPRTPLQRGAKSTSTCSPSTCTRPGPSGGDVHWRGAATGSSRASFEGLIKINPGAQQSHTYLQFHSMMLSRDAELDAIPSVLVSADDVSASHGGTVGELDEHVDLLHAVARPDATAGGARDRRGLLRAADRAARRRGTRSASSATASAPSSHAARADIERYALAR